MSLAESLPQLLGPVLGPALAELIAAVVARLLRELEATSIDDELVHLLTQVVRRVHVRHADAPDELKRQYAQHAVRAVVRNRSHPLPDSVLNLLIEAAVQEVKGKA